MWYCVCCCSFRWNELLRREAKLIGLLSLRQVGRIRNWLSVSLVVRKVILLLTWITSVSLLVGSLAGKVLLTGVRTVSTITKLLTTSLLLIPLTCLGSLEKRLRIGLVVLSYELQLIRLWVLKIEILACRRNLAGGCENEHGWICIQLWSLSLDWRRSDWLGCAWL